MNNLIHPAPIPDTTPVASELSITGIWDSAGIADLIRSKSSQGETPAFLFLGKAETALLRQHLAEAFGEEAVVTLKASYYQGLEVIPLECESFVFAGGRKTRRILQDPISHRPAWQDREISGLWQMRID
ncbi:MAG: hypothetical protein WCH40_12760 [Verrucomicrobiales bacterium]